MGQLQTTDKRFEYVNQLFNEDIPHTNDDFWDKLLSRPLEDGMMTLRIPAEVLWALRQKKPWNMAALVYTCAKRLVYFVENHVTRNCLIATNVLRLIWRVMPFVLTDLPETNEEPAKYSANIAQHILWENRTCNPDGSTFPVIIKDQALGKTLMSYLIKCAFVPVFAVKLNKAQEPTADHPDVEPHLLWYHGVGHNPATPPYGDDMSYYYNRTLLIRAILSCLAGQLGNENPFAHDEMRAVFLQEGGVQYAPTFVASLLSFAISYIPQGAMPYTSHLVSWAEDLTLTCLRTLLVLLDLSPFAKLRIEEPEGARDDTEPGSPKREESVSLQRSTSGGGMVPSYERTSFELTSHAAWSVIERATRGEVDSIVFGLLRLANNPLTAKQTWWPGSQKEIRVRDDAILLLWKMIDKSPNFREKFSKCPAAVSFLVPILDAVAAARDNEKNSHGPVLQVCVMMLMRLGTERDFIKNLNTPCTTRIPYLHSFSGTYADLLFTVLHSLLLSSKPWVSEVHLSCLTIMANISPFLTSLNSTTSTKLVNLFVSYADMDWLKSRENNCSFLERLVLTFANLLQYQYHASVHVLYMLVKKAQVVEAVYKAHIERQLPMRENLVKVFQIYTLYCAVTAVAEDINRGFEKDRNYDFIGYLNTTTLVGRIPVPHPILVQKFVTRPGTDAWVMRQTWSLVFDEMQPRVFDGATIQLFKIPGPVASPRAPAPAAALKKPPPKRPAPKQSEGTNHVDPNAAETQKNDEDQEMEETN